MKAKCKRIGCTSSVSTYGDVFCGEHFYEKLQRRTPFKAARRVTGAGKGVLTTEYVGGKPVAVDVLIKHRE
jgi:hypothetical protein